MELLLSQAKLPTVLRLYRDTLITEMKAAIKATVAALLPVLLARPLDSDLVTGDRVVDSDGLLPNSCLYPQTYYCSFCIHLLHYDRWEFVVGKQVAKSIFWKLCSTFECYFQSCTGKPIVVTLDILSYWLDVS